MAALASNIIILFLIEDLEAKFSTKYFSQCPEWTFFKFENIKGQSKLKSGGKREDFMII